jgi:hypothetical protein
MIRQAEKSTKNNSRVGKALYSFDFFINRWTKEASGIDLGMFYRTGTLDTRRHQICFIGEGAVNTLLTLSTFYAEERFHERR